MVFKSKLIFWWRIPFRQNLGLLVALAHESLVDAGGRRALLLDRRRAPVQQVRQVQQLRVSAVRADRVLRVSSNMYVDELVKSSH